MDVLRQSAMVNIMIILTNRRFFIFLCSFLSLFADFGTRAWAQVAVDQRIHVVVDLVQLNVAVTDRKGNYVTGLHPEDFAITEDGIPQKIATFGEGNEQVRGLADATALQDETMAQYATQGSDSGQRVSQGELRSLVAGANVFVLFDTSNYMYRGFVFAQDAIADFVRSLDGADKVAFYSYSRDLSRNTSLTSDRLQLLRGVRSTVAGDDAALYNCLLLTVRDAAKVAGRKVIVVFSNGPDDASVVPPEDVAELAQSTGTAIYMISTNQAHLEPISTAVFERMTAVTGGKAYFAKSWKDEKNAFASIREDLAHLYSVSYYPRPNPNRGWRTIAVKLVGDRLKNYRLRTRDGYRPQPLRFSTASVPVLPAGPVAP
jgi:Ca-activated chloride channel family protein